MQLTFDKTKRRLTIQSETTEESTHLKALAEEMKRYDSAINLTYINKLARVTTTPATSKFVLAANQFYKEQTAR
jgi:hypothetical protein